MLYSRLRNLMKYDTVDFRCIDPECLTEMPSYSFSFTIFIRRYPDLVCLFGIFLEFCDSFFLFWGYFIFWNESSGDIYTEIFGWKISYMTE